MGGSCGRIDEAILEDAGQNPMLALIAAAKSPGTLQR
jgi:hypothetical protein